MAERCAEANFEISDGTEVSVTVRQKGATLKTVVEKLFLTSQELLGKGREDAVSFNSWREGR